jgi:hypothetical protein
VLGIRALGVVAGAAAVLVPVLILGSNATSPAKPPRARSLPAAVSAAGLVERSGVRVVRVAATGGGGLLDLRYQVVDPGAAAGVHDPATPPALVDERTGLVIHRLLMGHEHRGVMKAGVTYYLVFTNPGNIVRRGDRVSVVLGGARLGHVLVW